MTTSLTAVTSARDIPDLPDRARMYRESGARLRAAMADNGVDALILLGNGNVVYATGASWPLLDAGLSHVERPVAHRAGRRRAPAPVHAVPRGRRRRSRRYLPITCTCRSTSNSTRASSISPALLAELIPAGATVAVDELTGAMRARGGPAVPGGPPSDAAPVVGRREAGEDTRPDRLHPQGLPHHRAGGRRRPEGAGAGGAADRPVGTVRAPGIRTRRHREHARGHLAGDADVQGRWHVDHPRRSRAVRC